MSHEKTFIKPDYEEIKSKMENNPKLHFSVVWEKYQQGDASMTWEEKRQLYYGYVFTKDYSPYAGTNISTEMKAIMSKEKLDRKDWEALIALLNNALQKDPFDCRCLYWQSKAYTALGKRKDAHRTLNKIRCILDALTSTGDGLSKQTAIHVIAVSQEYDFLFLNGLEMHTQLFIDGGYDLLQVVSSEGNEEDMTLMGNEDNLNELWFDVNQAMKRIGR